MPVENDFLPFATGVGANVIDQSDYVIAEGSWVGTGFQTGIATSDQLNKVWRQSSFVAAAVAALMANTLGVNILDDGNLAEFVVNLTNTIETLSGIKPGRVVTSSAALNILASDYAVGLARAAPAAQVAQLPVPALNQEFRVDDLAGNFNGSPVALTPPAGHSFAGLPANQAWPLAVNRGSWIVHYYGLIAGVGTWGISQCAG